MIKRFLEKARTRRELANLNTTFRAASQQLRVEVDRSKSELLGVPGDTLLHHVRGVGGDHRGRTGNPADRFDPEMSWPDVVWNALDLERSLLIFYLKFNHVACADQRPVFSGLVRDSERDIMTLDGLRAATFSWTETNRPTSPKRFT